MSADLTRIKEPMEEILDRLQDDEFVSEMRLKPAGSQEEVRITVENLELWAGDHRFDNDPEDFGIKESEGRCIRAYFQEGLINRDYGFIPELYDEFSEELDGERPEYIKEVNEYRESKGLEPFDRDESGQVSY